jgi:hypothetical protein
MTTPATPAPTVTAAAILKSDHPLNAAFSAWVIDRGQEPTKRQARKFLAAHPHYNVVKEA